MAVARDQIRRRQGFVVLLDVDPTNALSKEQTLDPVVVTAADRVIASRSFSSTLKQSKELEAASFGLIASLPPTADIRDKPVNVRL